MGIHFDEIRLKQEADAFKKVDLSPEQRVQLIEISQIVCDELKISCLAVRGFFLRAIKQWQIQEQKQITLLQDLPLSERTQAVRTIFHIVEEQYLRKILKHQGDASSLHETLQDAYQYYVEHYLS